MPAIAGRLAHLVQLSKSPREQALRELAAGHKRGHWIWWAFPTLTNRGGDMYSAWSGADISGLEEAETTEELLS